MQKLGKLLSPVQPVMVVIGLGVLDKFMGSSGEKLWWLSHEENGGDDSVVLMCHHILENFQ